MRRAWVGGVAAGALVAAAAWLLLSGTDAGDEGADDEEASSGDVLAPVEAEAAGLAGSTSAARGRDAGSRPGTGAIVGVVRRGGAPTAATVEATFLAEADEPWTRGYRATAYYRRLLAPPPSSEAVVATASAGADGRFALEGLGPGAYRVAARASDGARGAALATIPVDGARAEANPVLSAGTETLRGRVVHSDGRPWTGLVVVEPASEMFDALTMDLAAPPVAVDETGRFEAEGLGPDPVTVTALEPGVFRASSPPVALPHPGEYVLVVDASAQTLAGKVVADADGSPVGGATVIGAVQGTDFAAAMRAATSGPDGSFRLDVPGRGRPTLVVAAEGYATTSWWGSDPGAPIEVRLARAARLVGRVASAADRAPVPGLVVRATGLGGQTFAQGSAETDADGRYAIDDLGPGEAMAVADGGGWVTRGRPEASARGYNPLAVVLEAGKTTTLDLVVEKGARVVGRVVDAAGTAVAGAFVRATQATDLRRVLRGPPGRPAAPGEPIAASGADGAFSLDGLVPDASYAFTATAPERALAQAGPLVVAAAPPTEVELRFGASRWVDVTVVDDATGAPVAGVRVSAMLEIPPNGWGGDGSSAVSDGSGIARAGPYPAVAVRFLVHDGVFLQAQGPVVGPTETATTLRVRRARTLAGRVRFPDGTPAAYASVNAQPVDRSHGRWSPPATADADGAFRLDRLDDAPYVVRATAEREGRVLEASVRAAPGGEELTLRLGSAGGTGARLVVRVLDPDGRPVPRASVHARSSRGSIGTSVSDGRAVLDLSHLGSGDLTVAVWGAQRADGSPLPFAPYEGPVANPDDVLTVRLEGGTRIEGRVLDPDGKGLRGVTVTAEWPPGPNGQRTGSAVSTARTVEDGSFRLGGLAVEDYLLRAQLPPDLAPLDALPSRGGATGVEIRTRAGLRPTLAVLDWQGRPVAGAGVTVVESRPEGSPMPPYGRNWVATGAAGTVRLAALAPDRRYDLRVDRPNDRLDVLPLTRASWSPRDETFRLERAWFVKGVVRDPAGQPLPGATVMHETSEHGWNGVSVDAQGRFQVTDLPAGDVTLRAQMGDGGDPERTTRAVVPAGSDDVVLTVDPGPSLVVRVDGLPSTGFSWAQAFLRSDEPRASHAQQVSQEGTARFAGLRADATYTLFVGPVDGRSALRRGIRAGGEVRVSLTPGKSIRGRLLVPEGAEHTHVNASFEGFAHVQGAVERDGRYEIAGLQDGTWTVSAWAQVKDRGSAHARGETVAGGTLDLELKAR